MGDDLCLDCNTYVYHGKTINLSLITKEESHMNENMTCPQCGAPITPGAEECKFCGEKLIQQQVNQGFQQVQRFQPGYVQQPANVSGINPAWPVKNKIVAGVLAILLGGIGIHKFYLGKIGMGIVYILFCWTGITAVIGLVEGIVYLCSSDENFQLKHHIRVE